MVRMSNVPDSPLAPPPDAMCGQHPQRAAVLTCTRCGDFACSDCAALARQGLCPACAAREPALTFTLNRDTWGVENVFGHAWRTLTSRPWGPIGVTWAMLLPMFVVMMLPALLLIPALSKGGFTPQDLYSLRGRLSTIATSFASLLLISPLALGLVAYLSALVNGRRVGFEVISAQLPRVKQYAMMLLVVMPACGLVSLLQRTPTLPTDTAAGPLAALSMWSGNMLFNMLISLLSWPIMLVQYMGTIELVLDPNTSGLQAMKQAAMHILHRPFSTLGTTILISLTGLLSITCCFLPAIFFAPFALLTFTTLYLAIRTPAPPRTASW
jgi:hypothetical protein